ncbi:MAG: ABC transporter ATP-binding protein [Bacteroidota bacterium]
MKLSISELNTTYGNRNVLRDVSISLVEGLTFLAGLNGSGKTTLLHAIAGLKSYQGSIDLDGVNLLSLSRKDRARRMALVPQSLNTSFPIQIFDFVLSGRFPHLNWLGNYRSQDRVIVEKQLTAFGISHLARRTIREVSGGELQKALVARALVQQSPILLLDEPAQSLDPRHRLWLYNQLYQLADSGKMVICTTHDLEAIHRPKDRLIGVLNGQIIWDKAADQDKQEWMKVIYEVGKSGVNENESPSNKP